LATGVLEQPLLKLGRRAMFVTRNFEALGLVTVSDNKEAWIFTNTSRTWMTFTLRNMTLPESLRDRNVGLLGRLRRSNVDVLGKLRDGTVDLHEKLKNICP